MLDKLARALGYEAKPCEEWESKNNIPKLMGVYSSTGRLHIASRDTERLVQWLETERNIKPTIDID